MSTHLERMLDLDEPTLSQNFLLPQDRKVFHVAPKLHIVNDPSGTFTIKIKQGTSTVASKGLTVAEINTAIGGSPELYKWGYILFTFTNPINLSRDITYTIELSSSGYTFADNSSMGWLVEYVNETNELTTTPTDDGEKALSYRLWGF